MILRVIEVCFIRFAIWVAFLLAFTKASALSAIIAFVSVQLVASQARSREPHLSVR